MRRLIAEGSYSRAPEDLPYADVADRIIAAGFRLRGPVSDEMVEAAAQTMFEDPSEYGDYTWVRMIAEEPSRADIWRADARRVLEAAESVRVPSLGGQS